MEHTKTNIILVYRDGHYDHRYMLRVKARAAMKDLWTKYRNREELFFVHHRLTYR